MGESAGNGQKPRKNGRSALDRVMDTVNTVAYPVAAFSGAMVAETSIRKGMYRNFAKTGVFNALQAERKAKYLAAIEEAEHGGVAAHLPGRIEAIEAEYRHALKDWFEKRGVNHVGDYWKTLQRNQKIDAFVLGATVSGIAIGALLLVNDHRGLAKDLLGPDEPGAGAPGAQAL